MTTPLGAPRTVLHRPGCLCDGSTLNRCYPCAAHPGEILTADQWEAMREIYGNASWDGARLVRCLEAAIRRHVGAQPNDWASVGVDAVTDWLGLAPGDMVAAVRHVEAHEDGSGNTSACEPAYDDPACLAGQCQHVSCENRRIRERQAVAQARIRATPHVYRNTYLPGSELGAAVRSGNYVVVDQYLCMTMFCGLPYTDPVHVPAADSPGPAAVTGRPE